MKIITFTKHSNSYHSANLFLGFTLNVIALIWSLNSNLFTAIISASWLVVITYTWVTRVTYDIVLNKDDIELYINTPVFTNGFIRNQREQLASASTTQERLFRFKQLLTTGKMLMLNKQGNWIVILDNLSNKQMTNLKTIIGHSFDEIGNEPASTDN